MIRNARLRRFLAATLAVALCAALSFSSATAQPAAGEETLEDRIAGWDRTAEAVDAALEASEVNLDALDRLRVVMDEQRLEARALVETLDEELAPLRAQLETLGPAPAEGVEEAPEIAARRAELAERVARLEARKSEADLVATRAANLVGRLARFRRAEIAKLILRQGPSILESAVWSDGPTELAELSASVADEAADAAARLEPFDRHALGTVALALVAFALLATWRFRRRFYRGLIGTAQRRTGLLQRAFIALGLAVLRVFGPLVIAFGVLWWVAAAGVLNADGAQLVEGAAFGLVWATVGYAAAKLVYAPSAPPLRVVDLGDDRALSATRRLALFGVLAVLYDVVIGQLLLAEGRLAATTLAGTLLGALAGPLLVVIAQTLVRAPREESAPPASADAEGEEASEEFDLSASVLAVFRFALTMLGVVLPIAAALGYVSLARFLAVNTGLTLLLAAIAGVAYSALNRFVEGGEPQEPAQETAPGAGPRWRFAPLVIGFLIAGAAAPAFAFIWGASEADLISLGVGLIDGFEIGEDRFSPFDILLALFAFILGVWATRLVQGFLRRAVLPRTRLDSGARMSLVAGVGYIGFFLTALFAVSTAGLDLSNLAIVAGALSVGIGFGLQNIVNNFVSGLILLIERPIRVGDWIIVGAAQGYVRRINVRSTEIETFDRAAVIVPNSDLIASQVTNLTHRNLTGRVFVQIGVSYGSDPDRVLEILRAACAEHPRVLRYPEPLITFARFGESALEFEVRAYIRDVNYVLVATSDLNLDILKRLRAAGVEIPFPQRDVHVRSVPPSSEAFEPPSGSG